jgi:DNA-binding NtrC family response regulator
MGRNLLITGHASVKSAVEAMKLGAFDYMTKPLKADIVQLTVERALSFAKLKRENITLKDH